MNRIKAPEASQPKTYTAAEAARRLNVALSYLYGLLAIGRLSGHKEGKRWVIDAASIEERLKALGREGGE